MAAPAQAQVLPLLRWSRSASFICASPRRLFSALRRPAAAARCEAGSKAMLKGMDYSELENWVQAQGFRPGQAMMLWKCMYGNNVWAHCYDELTGMIQCSTPRCGRKAKVELSNSLSLIV